MPVAHAFGLFFFFIQQYNAYFTIILLAYSKTNQLSAIIIHFVDVNIDYKICAFFPLNDFTNGHIL